MRRQVTLKKEIISHKLAELSQLLSAKPVFKKLLRIFVSELDLLILIEKNSALKNGGSKQSWDKFWEGHSLRGQKGVPP